MIGRVYGGRPWFWGLLWTCTFGETGSSVWYRYLSHEIMSESANHSVERRRVEHVSTKEFTMETVTTDKPGASLASNDEHLGSSSTANGFSVIHSYLSKRSYPKCLCVTAFQLVHFQIAYHCSWWCYITQPYEMGCWRWPHFQYSNMQKLETMDCSGLQLRIVWQWVRTPATLTTTKAQCEGCSTWLHFSV